MILASVLVLLLTLFPTYSFASQDLLSAQQIMNLAVSKVNDDNELKAKRLTYQKRYTEEDVEYNKNGQLTVRKTRIELYQVYAKNGIWYEELIQKNGQTPNTKDSQPRLADIRPVIEDILGKPRYTYVLNGITDFYGKVVYSLSFEPRHASLQPKVDNDTSLREQVTNEIINNLSGLIYVDKDDYTVLRVEAHLTRTRSPLRIKTVGMVYIFDATVEQQKLYLDENTSIGVGKKVMILGKGAKFNIKIFELGGEFKRVTVKYEDYRFK